MNRKLMAVATTLAAVLLMTAGCSIAAPSQASASSSAGAGGPAQAQTTSPVSQTSAIPGRGITVVGVGKASGAPDVANVNVGVETQAPTVQQAVADNRAQMTKLLAALKALGIADRDVSTSNYSVYTDRQPVPGDQGGTNSAVSYRVSNQVQVVVRDVAKLGDVLDKAVEAGANNIYGVNFSVADTSKLENDARAQAISDARARAESLAKLAGVELGEVVSVSEVVGGGPLPYAKGAAEGLGGGSTPIQPGTLDVNTSVQVTFAIK